MRQPLFVKVQFFACDLTVLWLCTAQRVSRAETLHCNNSGYRSRPMMSSDDRIKQLCTHVLLC